MPAYNWFRVYHGTMSDPKWPLIARRSGQAVGTVVAVWMAILEFASQHETRGSLEGFCPEEIDALYGYEEGVTQSVFEAMESRGMIEDGALVAWDKRQGVRSTSASGNGGAPMTPAERSRRYRERQRESREATQRDDDVTQRDDDVTQRDDDVTQRDDDVTQRDDDVTQRDETQRNAAKRTDKIREDKRREDISPPYSPPSSVAGDGETADGTLGAVAPVSEKTEPKKRCRKQSNDEPLRPDDWERWYAAYPKHEGKKDGIRAWNALVEKGKLPPVEQLLGVLEWQIPHHDWKRVPKYAPLPASYLNAHRWEDEKPATTFTPNTQTSSRPLFGKPTTLDIAAANDAALERVMADMYGPEAAAATRGEGPVYDAQVSSPFAAIATRAN